jgi:Zn-dependent protease with chaperone function
MKPKSFHQFDTPVADGPHHGAVGCRCILHRRRIFSGLLVSAPLVWAFEAHAEGVEVGERSVAAQLVPAEQLESSAASQYRQMMRQAEDQRALAPADHPQLRRLRFICQRLVAYVGSPNLRSTPRASRWQWEVNLIASKQINAFCMPGGKIAFYTGILESLNLSDDEVAQIMGHEMAHALREHARERVGKSVATKGAIELGSSLLGLKGWGRAAADLGANLLTLKFSRDDESEADKIGLDLAARAGYDPAAGVSLWEKMSQASKGSSLQWLSTHPSGDTRIKDIQANLPDVNPLYAKAARPREVFGPPVPR